ncbi:MAG: PQQ-binding-like beta-propeller repeat protein [Gemmatales bacterium]|nr:PQQ-binding-like beta-propeller repeat protein [Gemmatales bacterium]
MPAMLWIQVLLILVGLCLGVWGLLRLLETMRLNVSDEERRHLQAVRWRYVLLMGLGDTLVVFGIVLIILYPQAWREAFRPAEWRDPERIERLRQQEFPEPTGQAQATDSAWPGWLGPNRNGISPERGLLESWPEAGLKERERWRVPIGSGYSSPIVVAGRVYVMDYRKPHERLVCFDAATGQLLGECSWRVEYRDVDTRWGGDYGPRATPVAEGKLVYAFGADGDLVCCELEPRNGQLPVVWRKQLPKLFPPELPGTWWGWSISPLVTGDLLIVITGSPKGAVVAFDRITGEVRWKALADKPAYSSPVLAKMPVAPEREQVIVLTAVQLAGLDKQTGEVLWTFPWTTQYDCNIATPIVSGNYVFISTDYGVGSALVEITRQADGQLRAEPVYQTRNYQNHFATSVLVGDRLYGFHGNTPAVLTCLDFRTGQTIWNARREVDKGCLLYADGRLIVFTENGELVLVEPTKDSYVIRGRYRVFPDSRSTWAMPALADGRLFVRDDRELVCLDLRR